MSSTFSRAPPLHLICSRYGLLYIGKIERSWKIRFGQHQRAVIGNDANQPIARYFDTGIHRVSDIEIRAICPISGRNDRHKRYEMRLISKLGTVHPYSINARNFDKSRH
jgi:hypothetical protein